MNRIMVVSPHPDDETLGAGGSLLKYRNQGKDIFWLNITNMSEDYGYAQERVGKRNDEIRLVNERYGFRDFLNLELEPAGLEKYTFSEVYPRIADFLLEVKPDTLILPNPSDAHTDHEAVFRWMSPFTKSFRYPFVQKVLVMEILSETEFSMGNTGFKPNYFVDVSDFMDEKIEMMKLYESEVGSGNFPRSERNIRALGTLRGSMSDRFYAEGFQLLKYVEK
ncbi:MAG: PIG-L family deacetylase [Peptostreptococcaceae bacterium]|nr:PIG-L family deacetylase [Peptostreptococcaceae bacterium]